MENERITSDSDNVMKKKRWLNDIILIAVLVLIPVLMLTMGAIRNINDDQPALLITVDGNSYETLPLSEDTELTVSTKSGFNKVIIMDGEAWVSDADCPEKICVYHSHISKSGEQIVCLPHKLVLEIISGEDGDVDSISH